MPTLPAALLLSGNTASPSPRDARMLAQQQVRLLGGMSRLLSRLLRGLLWQELTPAERRRVLALLSRLDSDLRLALVHRAGNDKEIGRASWRNADRLSAREARQRPPFS